LDSGRKENQVVPSPLTFDSLGVYLPEDIRSNVDRIAAQRGLTPQQLLNLELKKNRYRLFRAQDEQSFVAKARRVLSDHDWPADSLEALVVAALAASFLAQESDFMTGRAGRNMQSLV
jgi:hypothetical protein